MADGNDQKNDLTHARNKYKTNLIFHVNRNISLLDPAEQTPTESSPTELSLEVIITSLWMILISSYVEPLTTHLIQARIRDVFACQYNPNTTNIMIGWKRYPQEFMKREEDET